MYLEHSSRLARLARAAREVLVDSALGALVRDVSQEFCLP